MFYLTLPLVFLKFWYLEAPLNILKFFGSLNKSLLMLFSLPLLIRTYFKPWKNEYRKGLVVFSIAMGMFIKTFAIIADTFVFLSVLLIELVFLVAFLLWPLATLMLILR